MKAASLIALLICAFLWTAFSLKDSSDRQLKEITLTGPGYERGLQHGRQLKPQIAEIVERWKENTRRVTKKDPDGILTEFFEYADFDNSIRKWTPDLHDEVRGIAAGSGQSLEHILVLNLLDEFWVYLDIPENHHCSGIGVPSSGGRPAYVAQNMDLEAYTDGFQTLVRLPRNGEQPEQLILTHAGLIGLNGMNEAGVGVCVNTLMQLNASPSGLPVAFVVRGLIGQTDESEILQFIREVPHASGQNYLIGIKDEVFDFEASANKVIEFNPEGASGSVFHTNHALANTDLKPWYADTEAYSENSKARMKALRTRVTDARFQGGPSLGDILRSQDDPVHPVCRPNQGEGHSFTFASVIMRLGNKPSLQLAVGPPNESQYRSFTFRSLPQ